MDEGNQPSRERPGQPKSGITGTARGVARRLTRRRIMFLVVALVASGSLAFVFRSRESPVPSPQSPMCSGATIAAFGPNVCVFNAAMSQTKIQSALDNISTRQVPITSQFDSARYAILFEPGTYGSAADPLVFQVGYYTEVAGLGYLPHDTVINGAIDVFNSLCSPGTTNCNSDDNFWRSLSNLTLNVDLPRTPPANAPPVVDAHGAGCTNTEESWSASQAAPIRRVIVKGSIVFQDYCASDAYASGGFIADSQIGGLDFYGNQQYLVRNSDIGAATGCPQGLWNMVYSGVKGAPSPVFSGKCEQNTVLSTSPVTEEEPFLFTVGNNTYRVFVPALQHDSSGPSWSSGKEAGRSLSISSFFLANPGTPTPTINAALARGRNLILTPGIYNLERPILVSRPNTVVLGQGFATLVPQHGSAAMVITSNDGVKLSGLIIDAGPVNSPILLRVGTSTSSFATASSPDLIQDVFFRIGGAETTPVAATLSLLDNADNSIIDDVWAWRADHGNLVSWTKNMASTGVAVTGDDVTAYGLAVEHYQKYEVVWSGQGGTDVFFQNELPYDPPSQSTWMASTTQDGYPAFLVAPNVKRFQGYGMGSYAVFIHTTAALSDAEAFEAPDTADVRFHDLFAVWIAGKGEVDSIINGVGGPVTSTKPGTPVDIASYP